MDEYIVEFPLDDTLQERRRALEKLMIDAMQAFIPDVRIAVESTLMPRWYKEAAPIWADPEHTVMEVWTPEVAAALEAARKESKAAAEAAERSTQETLLEAIEDLHSLIEDELPALVDVPT